MRRWAPLWVASSAQLMVVLDVSVVNVALPRMQSELSIPGGSVQWVATAYALTFAGGLLVGGRLGDVFGVRRTLAVGLAVFVAASVVGGLAATGPVEIGARAAQGVGAAVASPATFTILTRSYPEGPQRTRAIAVWTAVSLAGGGLGNVVGGLLTELVSWRAVLLINLPVGVVVVLAAQHHLARQDRRRERRIDAAGAVLATVTLQSATLAVGEAGSSPRVAVAALLVALAGGLGFGLQQRRSTAPLIPPRLWRNRSVMAGDALIVLTGACLQAPIWLFLTYVMQREMDYTPLEAGVGFLPLTVTTMFVGTVLAPQLLDRVSPATIIAFGAATAAAGFVWQASALTGGYLATIGGPALVIGLGGGLLNTPLGVAATTGVADPDAGAASGVMNTAKQLGGSLGLASLTPVTAQYTSFAVAFVVMAALMTLVALAARFAIPRAVSA